MKIKLLTNGFYGRPGRIIDVTQPEADLLIARGAATTDLEGPFENVAVTGPPETVAKSYKGIRRK